jgi:type VI protein secretion system component VasK
MNRLATFAAITVVILMTNVVGAGVVLVIAPLVPIADDQGVTTVATFAIIMAVAIACAVCFLEGAIIQARRLAKKGSP